MSDGHETFVPQPGRLRLVLLWVALNRRAGRALSCRLLGVLLPRLQWGGAAVHDPSVWTGRALQAENDDLENVGLALLYSAY